MEMQGWSAGRKLAQALPVEDRCHIYDMNISDLGIKDDEALSVIQEMLNESHDITMLDVWCALQTVRSKKSNVP